MKKRIILLIVFFCLAAIAVFSAFYFNQNKASGDKTEEQRPTEIQDKQVVLDITPNATFGELMKQAGVSAKDTEDIFNVAKKVYDLSNIRVGKKIHLFYDSGSGQLKRLIYAMDTESELLVSRIEIGENSKATLTLLAADKVWQAEKKSIDYEVKIKVAGGTVEISMYEAALKNNIDERAIIDLADAFQWNIDFAMDPKAGDTFKFIYEERYLNGQYAMPGQILAGEYVNAGVDYRLYYFEESEGNKGFFDEEGNSVQKMFLKAPIQYKYITSGFTNGLRCLESFGLCTNHRAIDYAAPIGTPIRSVGDGTVIYAGWSSAGYGNLTSIRHNGTYSTNYAHQSKIIVKAGQKVKQGEIIGYVGSTGLSTGPHLHYELAKYGSKINPLTEVLPPGAPIKEENKERFFEAIEKYQAELAAD